LYSIEIGFKGVSLQPEKGMAMTIAYITPEVTLDRDLQFYSGGLGEVAGSMGRSAHAMGKDMVGVSLCYGQGYYEQGLGKDGMTVEYRDYQSKKNLLYTGKRCEIRIGGQAVYADIYENPAGQYESMPYYFLDTDIDANNQLGRINTQQLYGGSEMTGRNMERMIAQAMVLGIGAVEALRVLERKVDVYHLNESHAVFAPLYLLQEELAAGKNITDAIADVQKKVVFTNHTPIAAGNPKYSISMMLDLMGSDDMRGLLQQLGGEHWFDATVACLRLARGANGVSEKHLQTCREQWRDISGGASWNAVTNGVTTSYWQYPEFVCAENPQAIAEAKALYKRHLMYYLLGRTDKQFREDVLTIAWFRRFAEYKRPNLIFRDFEWIVSHLKFGHFQLVMGGKPHPDDSAMVKVWNEIYAWSKEFPNLVILAGYDPRMSKILKAGADLWLSSPRIPMEACSTSGMSGAMNGANLMSTPDGWICEVRPEDVFVYGTHIPSGYEQDVYDASEMRSCLDTLVIPMYYERKNEWYEKAMRVKRVAQDHYNSDRMLTEYWDRMYYPSA